MGADMTIAIARDVRYATAARTLLAQRFPTHDEENRPNWGNIDTVREIGRHAMYARAERVDYRLEEIEDVFHWHEDFDFDRAEEYTVEDMRTWMRTAIDLFVDNRREVTGFQINGVWYMASGGMSWGDSPTEAYDAIGVFAEYKFFDKPFGFREIQRAIAAHLATTQQ